MCGCWVAGAFGFKVLLFPPAPPADFRFAGGMAQTTPTYTTLKLSQSSQPFNFTKSTPRKNILKIHMRDNGTPKAGKRLFSRQFVCLLQSFRLLSNGGPYYTPRLNRQHFGSGVELWIGNDPGKDRFIRFQNWEIGHLFYLVFLHVLLQKHVVA